MRCDRAWSMPSIWTFKMKPIQKILHKYVGEGKGWVDPFAGMTSPAEIRNDINEDAPTQYHMDALEFLKQLDDESCYGVLFDPPYSVEMAKRRYKYNGFFDTATFVKYMSDCKREIGRIVELGGCAISFGWNSNGVGMNNGFRIIKVLIIAHGSYHYDTIVTVERKVEHQDTLGWLDGEV